jgi:hypothetical protein
MKKALYELAKMSESGMIWVSTHDLSVGLDITGVVAHALLSRVN